MTRIDTRGFIALCSALVIWFAAAPAFAHGVVGNRFFPATIATDDPAVAEELSLPTVSFFKNADGDRETDISTEYSKRITPNFGISLAETWMHVALPGAKDVDGFDNLGTSFKYQFVKDAQSETILSAGLDVDWGNTGADKVGAEHFTTFTPTLFFGKGMGGLPDSVALAKPFAITGLVGYAIPTRAHDGTDPIPQSLTYGVALEYSLPYLASHVHDYGFADVVNHLIPVVEASFESPVVRADGERTTGSIHPGVLWAGRYFQLGAEADLPINKDSAKTVGVTLQLHFFIDDIFPHSLGAPLFEEGAR